MDKTTKPYESVLAVVALLLLIQYFFLADQKWFAAFILLFVFINLLFASVARLIAKTWDILTKAIGFVSSHILLSVVFFFILTPIAFLFRLFQKKNKDNEASFFVERNHLFSAKDMESPW